MKYVTYIIFILVYTLPTGCHNESQRLNDVLTYSGANRSELEKVLKHYSQNPADSLKLKSAIFLIENMPGHYTFTGTFLEQYYAKLDTLKDVPCYEKKILQMLPFDSPDYRNDLQIQEDVKYIKADFLIHNIELAFRQWQTLPWLEGVDFNTFKEYLLPYRIENEPLDYWRDSVSYFQSRLKNYTDKYEDCRYSITEIQNKFDIYTLHARKKNPEKSLRNPEVACIMISKLQLFSYRTMGIPSTIDFIPHYANRNGRHYWAVGIKHNFKFFGIFQANVYRAAKVYRRTFSHNPTVIAHNNEYIPSFFRDPFNKDVTPLYLPTKDVTLDIPRNIKAHHVYLAIFNDLTWKPIACSEVSGRKACFQNMGKDIVYLPVYYDEETMLPLAPPFLIHSNGRIQHLNISRDSIQTLTLVRKYPNHSMRDYWYRNMLGTRFEAANQSDFRDADTVSVIKEKPTYQYQYITPDTILKKRYWRIINCNFLSDLHYYDTQQQEVRGRFMQTDSINALAIFDDSPLTYGKIDDWIGMDFGKPVSVSKIRYLPKSDANGIYPGYDYELFYYNFPEGWVSLGIQKATDYELKYKKVPAGSLYWLRNLTVGEEERVFTWENNKVRFW